MKWTVPSADSTLPGPSRNGRRTPGRGMSPAGKATPTTAIGPGARQGTLPATTGRGPSPLAPRPSPVARRPSPVARRPSPVARRPSPVARRPSPVARRPGSYGPQRALLSRRGSGPGGGRGIPRPRPAGGDPQQSASGSPIAMPRTSAQNRRSSGSATKTATLGSRSAASQASDAAIRRSSPLGPTELTDPTASARGPPESAYASTTPRRVGEGRAHLHAEPHRANPTSPGRRRPQPRT